MDKYTHHNGELTLKNLNQTVKLKGWVAKKRNLGGLIFIDLRDRFGITQVIVKPESSQYQTASDLKSEYVVELSGIVTNRESINPNLPTGEIEIIVDQLTILNTALTPPILISDSDDSLEETRMKYRYLDLRKPGQQQFIITRHQITQSVRNTLIQNGFYEFETPILGKSTPEGARDYLVPSRLYNQQFYALPQSPQIYKQLLMVAGFEKYFQIAKCFRDEDLRADRQPEFTQIDIEASFINQSDMMNLAEQVLANFFRDVLKKELKLPLKQITHFEAMEKYGSDKPDTRFGLEFIDYTNQFKDLPVFNNKEVIKGIITPINSIFTRKKLDQYTELVKKNHGEVLAYLKQESGQLSGSIAKLVTDSPILDDQMLFLVAGSKTNVAQSLGVLRKQLGSDLNLIDENQDDLLWVVDWPLLTFDTEANRFFAEHHPFTAPKDFETFRNNPATALAKAYDVVWNGYEIGGGSIRIHNQDQQQEMFNTLGFTNEEIQEQFGFFVDALKYGTPPHGGIAFGLDRLTMLATKTTNIKDVIAFPKTQSARDLMMNAPAEVSSAQLLELGLINKNK